MVMKEKFRDDICLGERYKVTKESVNNVCPIRDNCKRHIYRLSDKVKACYIDDPYDHNKKECIWFIKGE